MNTVLSLTLALALFPQAALSPSPVPAQPPAAPVLVTPVSPPPDTYVIGKQDQLKITVFEDDTLNGSFRVDADGMIQMNLINRITAAGITLRALQERVRAALADGQFIKNPTVRVEIEQYKSQYVT